MCYRLKEEVKRMSEKLYEVDQFYPGDFAQILTGVYKRSDTDMVPLIPSRTIFSFSSGVYTRSAVMYKAINNMDHN